MFQENVGWDEDVFFEHLLRSPKQIRVKDGRNGRFMLKIHRGYVFGWQDTAFYDMFISNLAEMYRAEPP